MANILVVENDHDLRGALQDVLETHGFAVTTAEHGAEALRLLDALEAQVIILDLDMPIMDGAEFLERRARSARLREIPVIVLSAWIDRVATPTAEVRLMKPASIDELLRAARALLGPQRLRLVH